MARGPRAGLVRSLLWLRSRKNAEVQVVCSKSNASQHDCTCAARAVVQTRRGLSSLPIYRLSSSFAPATLEPIAPSPPHNSNDNLPANGLLAWLTACALELCDIGRRRVWKFSDGCQVLFDLLEQWLGNPAEQPCHNEIFMRVHLDIVPFRVTGHRRARRENPGLSLRPCAGRMNVGEVHSPLLPSHSNQIGADKTQETFTMAHPAVAQ